MQGLKQWAKGMVMLASVWLATGCSSVDSKTAATQSLYDRLGGKTAIAAVIERFVTNVAHDTRINGRFATTDIAQLKKNLTDQVCMATGGPCTYTGRDMKTTHAGMRLTNADFNALVEDLVAALDAFKVPGPDQKELLGILGPMKKDIVEVP
jgi:hemoglobin